MLFFFNGKQCARQGTHIAPCRLTPNFARTGGREFISGVVEVVPGMRRDVGGAMAGSAGTEPLDRTVWVFSLCQTSKPTSTYFKGRTR